MAEPINARQGEAVDGIDELADQIFANDCTLVQALGVRRGEVANKKGGMAFGVFAGGRRLRALRRLVDRGVIDESHVVDVVVHDCSVERALEMSVIENDPKFRLPHHPLDQCDVFKKMIDGDASIEAVANYFVVKPWYVRQRLALCTLSNGIKAAWRAEEIDNKTAEAFTLTSSHKVQNDLFNRLKKANGSAGIHEHSVRQALAKNQSLASLLAFVGVDAYVARGGHIITDLFKSAEGGAMPEDADLVRVMASEKIDAKRKELAEQGWQFVGTLEELGQGAQWWKRQKTKLDFGDDQKTYDDVCKKLPKAGHYTDERQELEEQKVALEEAARARSYTEKDRAKSGVLIEFDMHAGRLDLSYGLLKPSDEKPRSAASKASGSGAATAAPKKDPEELTQALSMDLGAVVTTAVADVLGQDHQLALCVLVAGLLTVDYESPSKINHHGKGALGREGKGSFETNLKAMIAKKPGERLAILAALAGASLDATIDRKETQALLNACQPQQLDKAMRKAFDADRYFAGVNKTLNLKAIREAVGADAAKAVEAKGKADIVEAAVEQVPVTGWLPPELRAAHYPGPGGKAKTAAKAAKSGRKTRK